MNTISSRAFILASLGFADWLRRLFSTIALGSAGISLFLGGFAFAQKEDEKPAAVKKYELVSPGAIFPVAPGKADLEPKLDKVSAKVIMAKFGGATARMVVSEVTAEIVDQPDAGPMQASFELKPKLDFKPMINAMTFLPKRHLAEGWPRDKSVHFVIDDVLADSAPPNFAAAVMIECLLEGIEIPDNVVLFGGMNISGKISRGADKTRSDTSYVAAVRMAAAAALPPEPEEKDDKDAPRHARERPSAFGAKAGAVENSMILITGQMPVGTLDDFILDEEWEALNNTQVLRCTSFDDAVAFIAAIGEGSALGKSIIGLTAAQKELRERSIRMLNNEGVWSQVVAAGRASKDNATAFAYARLKGRKVADTYSLDRCLVGIGDQVEKVVGQAVGLAKFEDRELRDYMRGVTEEMVKVKRKIHPEAAAFYTAAEEYLDAAAAKIKAQRKVGRNGEISERVTEKFAEKAKVYSDARAEAEGKLK